MLVTIQPFFAERDLNLLAVVAFAIVAVLFLEGIREWRKKRRERKAREDRDRRRQDHWGYT